MKTGKLLIFVAMGALVALLALAGCGGSQQSSEPASDQSQSATQSAQQDQAATQDQSATQSAKQDQGATQSAQQDQGAAQDQGTAPANDASAYIGEEAAKDAALSHAGVAAADCTELEIELDLDELPVHYDVGFKVGNMEYDYNIDATTGEVLTFDSEVDNDD